MQVNLNSTLILTQAALPLLKQAELGSIIFTLSDLNKTPKANWGAYAVANSGCEALMRMLAIESENLTRIRVNAIQPNKVKTLLRNEAYPAEPHTSLCEPQDIVANYLYLMSDASRHLNGQILVTEESLLRCLA